jgi:hypothetical protein
MWKWTGRSVDVKRRKCGILKIEAEKHEDIETKDLQTASAVKLVYRPYSQQNFPFAMI